MADRFSVKIELPIDADVHAATKWWNVAAKAANPDTPPEELTGLAAGDDDLIQDQVGRNPNCPPLVQMWLQSGRYGGMTLKEFLESACPPT